VPRMRGWIELLTVSEKKILLRVWDGQKDRRMNTSGRNVKEKKEIKTGEDFWATENWNCDSNSFLFRNSSKHLQVVSYFVHLVL
jgi:hypothetical protein